jgi:perosamine synthetase
MTVSLKIPAARVAFSPDDVRAICDLLTRSLQTGALTLGPVGREFETEFARVCQRKHAVAVSSGTSAIEIALRCVGVTGRDVLVPANTFFATAAAAMHSGARVRLVDIEHDTLAMNMRDLERKVDHNTAAVVMVHIGGVVSPRTTQIAEFCQARGIAFIEDAAHALGSTLETRAAGSFGLAGCFSLYPTKIITSGEGGMIVTDDEQLANEARIYRDQGKAGFTQNLHTRLGYNWRLSEPHAAIGLVHMRHLAEFVAERRVLAQQYDTLLARCPQLRAMPTPAGCASNYYKYLAWLPDGVDRGRLKAQLREEYGVALSGEVYELPLHLQPVFETLAAPGTLPVAEAACARHICLPIYQGMSHSDVEFVVAALTAVLRSA